MSESRDTFKDGVTQTIKTNKKKSVTGNLIRDTLKQLADLVWFKDEDVGEGGGLELGETDTTAYRGDRGKTAYDHSQVAHAPSNATQNDTDANLKARGNHTGEQAISTVTGLQAAIDGKEPANANIQAHIASAHAPSNAVAQAATYTDAEITELKDGVAGAGDTLQKLYNLIVANANEVIVADIAARNAYDVPSLPFNIFVTDDGDTKWALYHATTTGVGATFVKLSDPDLLNAVMSNAAVKTAYESNADTNAFTNALLSKLNAIAAGATANDTDANLKARANHTGTQLAATISDFNAAALAAAPAETTTTMGALLNGATEKTTPVDADRFGLMDTAGGNVLKWFSWANVKAKLKDYYDTLYQAAGSYLTAANIVQTIKNGQTTTAPSEDVVSDYLLNKTLANSAEFSQVVVSGTAYYITGSAINFPADLRVTQTFSWDIMMTKTAAGTGTFQIRIYRGTNGTTADTADVTQTIGTQTAAVDTMMLRVTIHVTTLGGTGAYFWTITPMNKAATATGFGVATGTTGLFSGTVSSVAMDTANLKFGIAFIATTGTPTVRVVQIKKSV